MKIDEVDKKILIQVIEIQNCIIEGRNLKAILHKNMNLYRADTEADIIAVCLKENSDTFNIRYILEEKRIFVHLIKKYFPERRSIAWQDFIAHCKLHFSNAQEYMHIHDFSEVFSPMISTKNCMLMTEELGMKDTVIIPIYKKNSQEKIGFVFYIYRSSISNEIKKLQMNALFFQTIFQPFYEDHCKTSLSKTIEDNMQCLTSQEKRVVKNVLDGYTYAKCAERLSVSINTIKTQMKNIFSKLGVNSKIELFKKLNKRK